MNYSIGYVLIYCRHIYTVDTVIIVDRLQYIKNYTICYILIYCKHIYSVDPVIIVDRVIDYLLTIAAFTYLTMQTWLRDQTTARAPTRSCVAGTNTACTSWS